MKKASIGLLIFGVFCIVFRRVLSVDDTDVFDFLDNVLFLWGTVSVLCGAVLTIFNNFFKKHCSLKSLSFAFGISMFTGFGCNCLIRVGGITLFGSPDRDPIDFSISLFVGFFCLIAVTVLFSLYIMYRHKNPSFIGVISDVVFGLIYVVPFMIMYGSIYAVCKYLFHYFFPNL